MIALLGFNPSPFTVHLSPVTLTQFPHFVFLPRTTASSSLSLSACLPTYLSTCTSRTQPTHPRMHTHVLRRGRVTATMYSLPPPPKISSRHPFPHHCVFTPSVAPFTVQSPSSSSRPMLHHHAHAFCLRALCFSAPPRSPLPDCHMSCRMHPLPSPSLGPLPQTDGAGLALPGAAGPVAHRAWFRAARSQR